MKVRLIYFCLILLISSCSTESNPVVSNQTPLETLLEGNERFNQGKSIHPDESIDYLSNLKKGQHPVAVVISCSDSRVPPELVFDQGLGKIFSIRTAGNVIGDYELGSIEYAVEHLKCNLIIVLGHENCGAVDAFIHNPHDKKGGHIQTIVDYIANEEEEKAIPAAMRSNIEMAVKANILHGVHLLKNSEPELKEVFKAGKLEIVGAFYDLDNGQVKLLKDKS